MNRFIKTMAALSLLCATTTHTKHEKDAFGKPFFLNRSQGHNLPRRLVGEAHELYRCDLACLNGIVSLTPEWSQTFNSDALGRYFSFKNPGQKNPTTMQFRGRLAPNFTDDTNVQAENFLLPSDFEGQVTFEPNVQNFIADINFRLNLDEWACGLYFEVGIPINWTRWDMNLKETMPTGTGLISIEAADINQDSYTTQAPFTGIIDAWKGLEKERTFTFANGADPDINITIKKMEFARINASQHKTSIAGLQFILGYKFLCTDTYHLAANLRVVAPTGTRPSGKFVFEPLVGNGRHTQLGGGISAHYLFWDSGCDQSLSMWFDSAVYHLFSVKQKRTFDLKNNGIGSRYLLFKQFQEGQFLSGNAGTFVPGPNVTTLESKVKIDVVGEALLMLDYQHCGWTVDVGYNIWGRTKENIKLDEEIEKGTFGLWGGTPIDNINVPNAQNRTNSQVKIDGQGFVQNGVPFDQPSPQTVSNENIDMEGAQAPAAVSHKFFTHLGYIWETCDYSPFFGVGGEVEFSGKQNKAFDQWGVWAKGGFAFA